jgi:PAS domain-containing protein
VLTVKQPLRDLQGAIIGTFGISRDITDRKLAEERLRKSERDYLEAQKLAHIGSWTCVCWTARASSST